ncbi:UNVERIFIED_CONTAM: hypothetical protein FKN15_054060 [Acipenser sinensis]
MVGSSGIGSSSDRLKVNCLRRKGVLKTTPSRTRKDFEADGVDPIPMESYSHFDMKGWSDRLVSDLLQIGLNKIPSKGKLIWTITTDMCEGKDNFVRYLEHVQAVITVNATRRGDLNINMTSPMGTKSILLSRRPRDDDSKVGFDKWPFMTTHTWGEDPRGTWVLEIGFEGDALQKGVMKEWTLMLHGTQSAPYIDQIVRDYQSKLAMSKKEELEEELDEAVERSLKSLLSKN